MKVLKGQRWAYHDFYLVEVLENKEFDQKAISVECRRIDRGCSELGYWYFGGGFQSSWKYLEGQDRPLETL